MRQTKIYIADANSTDGTPELALAFRDRLNVEVIPGGLPSVGRNAGAQRATTPYVLFLDADIELADCTLIRRSIEKMQRKRLHCLTTNIWCREGNRRDHLLYAANDAAQWLSRFFKPFSTGMYMMFDREQFLALGGFNEKALYAEDYQLSKRVARRCFGVVRGKVLTTNRRFQKMGHTKVLRMFLRTMLNSWNENYFLLDQKYWQA
jgi:glycosyltransferase involved in cell wall biosynthesis